MEEQKQIVIRFNGKALNATLKDTGTAKEIYNNLPLEGEAQVWGGEIYFVTNLHILPEQDAMEEVEPGTLAYWPVGGAFCLFFGLTPVSTGKMPRAYSPVNVFGEISGDLNELKSVKQGDPIKIEK